MVRHRSETALAIGTLVAAAIHFTLETWYHVLWGQPAQALVVDYISVTLMTVGGIRSLRVRPASAAGLLAAAWGFALGFSWRSVFGRLELRDAGAPTANGEPGWIVFLLMGVIVVVAGVLLWALVLTWRQSRQAPRS